MQPCIHPRHWICLDLSNLNCSLHWLLLFESAGDQRGQDHSSLMCWESHNLVSSAPCWHDEWYQDTRAVEWQICLDCMKPSSQDYYPNVSRTLSKVMLRPFMGCLQDLLGLLCNPPVIVLKCVRKGWLSMIFLGGWSELTIL